MPAVQLQLLGKTRPSDSISFFPVFHPISELTIKENNKIGLINVFTPVADAFYALKTFTNLGFERFRKCLFTWDIIPEFRYIFGNSDSILSKESEINTNAFKLT
ncbi:MAG: hypothetical protein ABSB94_02925 [Syntrophorhabdales bacterium]